MKWACKHGPGALVSGAREGSSVTPIILTEEWSQLCSFWNEMKVERRSISDWGDGKGTPAQTHRHPSYPFHVTPLCPDGKGTLRKP